MKKIKILSLVIIVTLFVATPLFFVFAEEQITTNESGQYDPAVYGEKIVWQDMRNDDGNWNYSDIYMYDLGTQEETRITPEGIYAESPAIFGNKIVWEEYRNGNDDIYMYDLDAQEETRITTELAYADAPSIFENTIVWQDYRNGNYDIYMYDLDSETETQITDNEFDQFYPSVYNDKIVWQDSRNDDGNGSYSDIYMYDLGTQEETRITPEGSYANKPSIFENKIVWYDYRGENGDADIYMYNIDTQEETQITSDGADQYAPVIYGNNIIWEDYRNGNYDIFMYNLSTQEETALIVDEADQYYLSIFENRIVWQDYRNGEADIYLYKLPVQVESFSPVDDSEDSPVDSNLSINFDREVFQGEGNVYIKKSSDDSVIDTINISSSQVNGWGSDTITINPSNSLSALTQYYLLIDENAIRDSGDVYYSGISSADIWNFTTGSDGVHFRYNEEFYNNDFKDTINTTGIWNTTEGMATMIENLTGVWTQADGTTEGMETVDSQSPHDSNKIILDDLRRPMILYNTATFDLRFTRWNGSVWTQADGTTEGYDILSTGAAQNIQLETDSDGLPFVSWSSSNDLYLIKWDGASWVYADGTEADLDALVPIDTDISGYNYLKISSDDNPVVSWRKWVVDSYQLNFSKWNGDEWTKADGETAGYDVVDDDMVSYDIKLDGNNNPEIVFDGSDGIYFTKWDGGEWTSAELISDSTATNPIINLDNSDRPHAVWNSDNGAGFTFWNGSDWVEADGETAGWEDIEGISNPKIIFDHNDRPVIYGYTMNGDQYEIKFTRWNGSVWTNADGETEGIEIIANSQDENTSPGNLELIANFASDKFYASWNASSMACTHFIYWNGSDWTNADGETAGDEIISGSSIIHSSDLLFDQDSSVAYASWSTESSSQFSKVSLASSEESVIVQSLKINTSIEDNIASATLTAGDTTPGASRIEYFLSNNGGVTWEEVENGVEHIFTNIGNDLRWKAILYHGSVPTIESLDIIYALNISDEGNDNSNKEEENENDEIKIKSILGDCNSLDVVVSVEDYEKEKVDFKVEFENISTGNKDEIKFENIKTDSNGKAKLNISPLKYGASYRVRVKFKKYNKEYSDWSSKKNGETSGCVIISQTETPQATVENILPNEENKITQKAIPLEKKEREIKKDSKSKFVKGMLSFIENNKQRALPISTAALTLSLVAFISRLNSLSDVKVLSRSLLAFISRLFAGRKREWGVVFDNYSGKPIAMAVVSIFNEYHKKADSRITDNSGAYSFLIPPGQYYMKVEKKGYQFDSSGEKSVIFYSEQYDGGEIEAKKDDIIRKDIAMKPEKATYQKMIKLFKIKKFVGNILLYGGLLFSVFALLVDQSVWNYSICFIYLSSAFLSYGLMAGVKWGMVRNENSKPEAFATIKITDKKSNELKARTITDEKGRYFLILDQGDYTAEISTVSGKKLKTDLSPKERKSIRKIFAV